MNKVNEIGEFGLIERISKMLPTSPDVIKGIGDDCAVLQIADKQILVSCDLFIENIHFRREYAEPFDIGWKAASAALSDIAAMGGQPQFALISFACPTDTEISFVNEIFAGLEKAMSACGSVIVGGDTTRSSEGIIIDVTVIGEALGGHYLLREGAMHSDLLAITGNLGCSSAGFHALENNKYAPELIKAHHHPIPRIKEAQWLCSNENTHAMIDITDGLVQDAGHLVENNKIGINIIPEDIPIDPELAKYCKENELSPMDFIMTGGEDYELAFAIDPEDANKTLSEFRKVFQTEITIIGEFSKEWEGLRVGGKAPKSCGFDHFAYK